MRSAGMRYVGQSYEVDTPVPSGSLDAEALADIQQEFNHVHEREHGVYSDEFPIAFVNLRITAVGKTRKPDVRAHFIDGSRSGDGKATTVKRNIYFDGEFSTEPGLRGYQPRDPKPNSRAQQSSSIRIRKSSCRPA